jgi:hypothetical protein
LAFQDSFASLMYTTKYPGLDVPLHRAFLNVSKQGSKEWMTHNSERQIASLEADELIGKV